MSFFDIVLDFILMDAFEDLENPPSSVLAVLRNRWLSDSFKETVGGCPPHTHVTPHFGPDSAFLRPWLWVPGLGPPPVRQQSPPWAGSPPPHDVRLRNPGRPGVCCGAASQGTPLFSVPV